ncbi:MAG: sugar phosphate isomerase/epimerase family protein [Acidobacteriaceae bacterium]
MLKAISTYVHVRERLHPGILDGLVRAGAQAIEIFGARGHFDYTSAQHVREIASWFHSNQVEFHSMHSPMYSDMDWERRSSSLNIASKDRKTRIEAMDEIKRAIEIAERLPFRFLIQHIGTSSESFDMHKFDAAMTSIEHLKAFAKPLGVKLLIENIPNELSTPEKIVELIRTGHFDDVGVCFDTGHAHLEGGVAPALEMLKDYVRSTHIHDNKQDRDSHLVPGDGTIDWNLTMEILRTAPQVPPVLLELEGDPEGNPEFGKKLPEMTARAWTKLE